MLKGDIQLYWAEAVYGDGQPLIHSQLLINHCPSYQDNELTIL